jgi:hypothetical protein
MIQFRICTIANNLDQYGEMRDSIENAGFTSENSVFELFDNSKQNLAEPYSTFNQVLSRATEPYLIFCHQDVLFNQGDGSQKLLSLIEKMNSEHPNWAVLGNAGVNLNRQFVRRITDAFGSFNEGPLPQQVISLDENFLVIKQEAHLTFSKNLSGFHLYGVDLCLNAYLKGHSCYVIDFHLNHLSGGNINDSFHILKKQFQEVWGPQFNFLYVPTVCTTIFLSKNRYLMAFFTKNKVERKFHQYFSAITQRGLRAFANSRTLKS